MKIEDMIFANRADCSGCEACANTCPRNAITMRRDAEGFAYPAVNRELCIGCGKCDAVCPALNFAKKIPDALPNVFVAVNPNAKIRRHSSSGGVFSALSELVLRDGGIVFGAAFDENFHVKHTAVETLDELEKLRGSKYVQSQIGDVYRQVKDALKSRQVLFSGTPCQCAGLKSFLGKDNENLLTVEIICHGTPSPMLWENYIGELGYAHEIRHVNFRSKRKGWTTSHLEINFADQGYYLKMVGQDTYGKLFLSGLSERPSCHACKFRFPNGKSDLTIGDAWGIQKFAPEMFDNRGASVVFVHTAKGNDFFERATLIKRQVRFFDAALKNPAFIVPLAADSRREIFFANIKQIADKFAVMQYFAAQDDSAIRKQVGEKNRHALMQSYQEIAAQIRQNFKRNVLIMVHNWGGGAEIFLDHYIKQHYQNCGVYILQREEGRFICTERFSSLTFALKEDPAALTEFADKLNITEIFANHLINFNLPLIANWLVSCGRPFKFFVHDFFCVCPNYQLECLMQFCNVSATHELCRRKFAKYHYPNVKIGDWRKFFGDFLSRAEEVITPSTVAANIVKSIYPTLPVKVEPHYITTPLQKTFRPEFAARKKLRVTFLGNMFDIKGEEYLFKLNDFIQREQLPIELVALGKYMGKFEFGSGKGIIFAGEYDYGKVSQKLSQYETAIVTVLSIVPETFCYTASEAILSGYPVLSSNIGAQAVRVYKNNCGWIANLTAPDRGFAALENFLRFICTPEGRREILNRASQTANFVNGTE